MNCRSEISITLGPFLKYAHLKPITPELRAERVSQVQAEGFSLVSGLAAELSKGDIKLPSLPEAVIRIRNALAQPDFTIEELARLISTPRRKHF